MKLQFVSWLLPVILLGCSKHPEAAGNVEAASDIKPPQISYIEGAETTEANEIGSRALKLLTQKDYDGLDAMAAGYRASNEQFSNGFAKLATMYNALEPGSESDEVWQTRMSEVREWMRAKPQSPTARIALARIMTGYAWKVRGSDYADKVKQENWTKFFSELQQAREILEPAKDLKCPAYWSSLQLIALGSQVDRVEYDKIFAEAIQQFPDYVYYYKARAQYLMPRWNGKEGEWVSDLTKSADRIGGEAGDMVYAQVSWDMSEATPAGNFFDDNKELSWERIDRGFDVIQKKYPDSLAAKSRRAYFAAVAGQKEKARSYFLQTKGQVDLAMWDSDKGEVERFLKWTFSP